MFARLARKTLNALVEAAGTLPGLGFGRAQEPPTEPIQRSETPVAPTEPHALHNQQHVNPGRRSEIDKPTE